MQAQRPDRVFTLMLGGALAGTMLLAGLTAAALRADHPTTVQTLTGNAGGGPGGGGTAATSAQPGSVQHQGGGAGAAPGGAPNQGVSGGVIHLGAVITQSGPGRSITMAHAVVAWEQSVNAAGGINGYKVSVDIRDDQGNPELGASEYRELEESEHVLAFVSECAPLTDEQQVAYINAQHLPVVGECQSSPAAYQSPYLWVAGPTPTGNGDLGAALMEKTQHWPASGAQIALVCLDDPSTTQVCQGAARRYGSGALWHGGPQMEEITDNNYPQLIAEWQSAGISHVHLVLDPGSVQRYLYAAQAAGYTPQTMNNLVIDDGVASQFSNAQGMMIGTPWTPLDRSSPGMQRFETALHTYFPDDRPDLYAQTGWIGCLVLEHALKSLGSSISRQGLINALGSIRGWDTGLGPVENYASGAHAGPLESWLMRLDGAGSSSWRLVTASGQISD